MQRSRWMRTVAAATALVFAAAACGNGETDEPAEPEVEPEAEPDTEEEPESEPEVDPEEVEEVESDDVLNMGYILPETGQLAYLGPPQIQGVELAVSDINAAGGVLGQDVTISGGDEAGDTTIAAESAQRLIGEGVNVIVGAAASGMSLAFTDAVTGAGVLQCSASNTAPTFTNLDLNGLYFRTAPTDVLQGPVLAETVVGDGNSNPAILARADDYGRGLMEATVEELEAQGASVAAQISYDPEAATFDAEVGEASGSGADSIVVIAFDEGAQILASMVEAGAGPADIPVYGADGLRSNELAELVDPNHPSVLEGMKGTAPSPDASPDFLERFQEETGLDDPTYAAQAYDCAVLAALAAEAAGSDLGTDIAAEMMAVATGDTECETVEECLEAVRNGESVAYQTASGVVLMETETGNGEPESGEYEVWEIDDTGAVSTIETVVSGF